MNNRLTLDELGIKYGTDKASKCSELLACDFLRHYERYLYHMRDKKITLLEFGIWKGQSLQMWREYFSNAVIIGVDKDVSQISIDDINNDSHIKIIEKDIFAPDLKEEILKYTDNLDVIIDDSLHAWCSQRILFEQFFPLVSSGGVYIVEDVRVQSMGDIQYTQEYEYDCERINFTNYSKKYLEYLRFSKEYRQPPYESKATANIISQGELLRIESINYIPDAVIITKE